MRLDELNLNKALTDRLSSAIDSGRLPHAVILEGGSTENRRAAAIALAAALVCGAPQSKPCGICSDCIKSSAGTHPDIFICEGNEEQKSYPIDLIRQIRSDAYIMPNEASYKVYVLLNAQLMTDYAQNALLKILEEPPEYARFILTCGSKASMLSTVLSRATVFALGVEELPAEDELSQRAKETALAIAKAIAAPGELAVMRETSVLEKDKALFKACLPELRSILCDALVLKNSGSGNGSETVKLLATQVSSVRLIEMLNDVEQIIEAIKRNANHNLQITRLCMKLR